MYHQVGTHSGNHTYLGKQLNLYLAQITSGGVSSCKSVALINYIRCGLRVKYLWSFRK